MKNQVGAPVKMIDASAGEAGIFRATLQFDDSGTWNAYALRWTADYSPEHKHTFARTFDKVIGPDGSFTGATFAPNAITLSKDSFLANDKNDPPQAAKGRGGGVAPNQERWFHPRRHYR